MSKGHVMQLVDVLCGLFHVDYDGFDYPHASRVGFPTCQFDVSNDNDHVDCGKPAVAFWLWEKEHGGLAELTTDDIMFVCEEHDKFMKDAESKDIKDEL